MSLEIDGVWKSGVWATTVWAAGVWFEGARPAVVAVKTGTGGIDPVRRGSVKPTGILHLPKKKGGSPQVQVRVDESHEIQAEIAGRLAKEFSEESVRIGEQQAIEALSQAQVSAEIAMLLKKKLRTEDDEIMLLLLMVAATA